MKEKLDTLSDAIIAIAITILVLEIHVPATAAELSIFLSQLLLFILSFVVIANFWYERSFFMRQLHSASLKLITVDLVAHLGICLIPLMTKFMFSYEDPRLSVISYGLLILFVSTILDVENDFVMRQELERVHFERCEEVLQYYRRFHVTIFYRSLLLVVLAYFAPQVVVYFYSLIPVIKFLTRSRSGRGFMKQDTTIETLAVTILERVDNMENHQKK